MGATDEFTCKSCGYSAEVSGGQDYGFIAMVETMVSESCRKLVDVLVKVMGVRQPILLRPEILENALSAIRPMSAIGITMPGHVQNAGAAW